jgi:transcriptional regulator with XRE-family HTH domain
VDVPTALRRARTRAGLSQRALAGLTGVAQPTIARIERGHEQPRVDTLRTLLTACGHRIDIAPVGGEGIDRTAIRQLLNLTPAERAQLAMREGRTIDAIPLGVLTPRRARPS